jgi:hypothetical protein
MPKTSKTTRRARASRLALGIEKHLVSGKTYLIKGERFTRASLLALLAEYGEAQRRTDAARAALRGAVAAEALLDGRVDRLVQDMRLFILTTYGKKNLAMLGDFGWDPPRKRGPKTVEGKLQGVVKRAAKRRGR